MSSVINSSSTPLVGNGEFPGAWEFLTVDKHGVEVVCSTDAPGNLIIEFSQNKIDINYTHTYTIEADVSFSRAVSKKGNYYKVSLVNGPSAQTTLQLVSIIQTTYQPDTLDVVLDSATSSITVFGQDTDGVKRVLKTTTDGTLVTSGGGGGGGGDASAANQTLQLTQATNANLAICSRLDLIDTTTNNMEVVLDNMVFTTGNLMVRDTQLNTTLTNSNLATNTKLGLIAEATEDTLLSVDGINTKLNALQLMSAKYTIEAAPSLAPDTSPAFSAPPSGIEKSEGWYFKNTATGQPSQLYYYSYLNPATQVPARQFGYQLNDISIGYCVVTMLSVNASAGLVTLALYSRPTGSGDSVPGFYKSRKVYAIPNNSTAKLTQGMKVMLWWGSVAPSLKLHPNITRIQLDLVSTNGPAVGTEQLAFLTLQTDSTALAGNAEYIVSAAGFQYAAELIMDTTFTGESSATVAGSDATAANQTASNTAVCARLDASNVVLTNINTNLDQLTYTGSNLQVQDIKLSNELSSLTSSIGQGVYINMETTPPVSGGVKLTGSNDGNLFVYDAACNTTLGLVNSELTTLNGVYTDLISGDAQMYVKIDGTDDSIQILGIDSTSLIPSPVYTVDNAAKVYVDNVVDVLLLAKNSVDNNVNLLVDAEQRLLSNTVIVGTVPVSGTFYQETQPVSIAETVAVSGTFWQETQPVSIDGTVPVSGTFYQETQPVSISGTVAISSGEPLDCHVYGSSDGTAWHHIKTNNNGVVSTNAIMETDANGALTSTVNDDINALDVQVQNTVATNVRTNLGGFLTSTLVGTKNTLDVVAERLNTANGSLTSTLSGTGNSINSLDVAVKNSVSVQNVSSTQLDVKNSDSTAIITSPRNSNALQVASSAAVMAPQRVGNINADTQGYTYIAAIMRASSVTSGGQIYLEVSHDENIWVRPQMSSAFLMASVVQVDASIILSTPIPFRYARLFADSGVDIPSINAWIVMK